MQSLIVIYLPRFGEIVTILTDMFLAANKGVFLKKSALLLSAMLFLGSFEVSAYTASADSRLSLHNQDLAHSVDATDELFAESGEERDGESLTDLCFANEVVGLPNTDLVAEKIKGTVLVLKSSLTFSPQNSRAPPAL